MLIRIGLFSLFMFSFGAKAQIKTVELKQLTYCQHMTYHAGKIYLTGATYHSGYSGFSKVFCIDTSLNTCWDVTLADSSSNTVNGLNFHENKTLVTYLAGATEPGAGRITGRLSYMLAVVDSVGNIETKTNLVSNVGWSTNENISVMAGDKLIFFYHKHINEHAYLGEFGSYNLKTGAVELSNLGLTDYLPDLFLVEDGSYYFFGSKNQEPKFRQVSNQFELVKTKTYALPSSLILKHWFFSKKEQTFFVFTGGLGEPETKQGATTVLSIDLNGNLAYTKTFALDTLAKTDVLHKYYGDSYWNDEDDCYIVVNNASGDKRLMKINAGTGKVTQKPLSFFMEHPAYRFNDFLVQDGYLYAHIYTSDRALTKTSWLAKIPFNME